MNILVIDGPNINLLGMREPHIYGDESYMDLLELLNYCSSKYRIKIDHFQSNWEGAIIDRIQEALAKYDGIVINAGAYTHTSLAIGDALRAVNIPTVEVHISKVSEREDFRQVNFIKDIAIKTIEGHGIKGYELAISYLNKYVSEKTIKK